MLRSICKKTDSGAQYAYTHVSIEANRLVLENKRARSDSVERQDGAVQWRKSCLYIHGQGLSDLNCLGKATKIFLLVSHGVLRDVFELRMAWIQTGARTASH
jgi:hypothetical protein